MIQWHRLFGLTLTDFFHDTSYKVEIEKDLSLIRQLLDVVVVERRPCEAPEPEMLPDGLEDLSAHNLVTFKSHWQALDHWAVEELAGHYVNYRKQASPSLDKLLPEDDFRLYAVCARFPRKLSKQCEFRRLKQGVYDFTWGVRSVRIIVTGQVRKAERNLLWLLFSAVPDKVMYGAWRYRWKIRTSRVVKRLLEKCIVEEVFMTYTMEDFNREIKDEVLQSLTEEDIEDLLKRLGPEDLLKRLGPEERLRGLGPEERLRGLGTEERLRGLGTEEILKVLKPEEIEKYLEKIKAKTRSRSES